MLPIGIANPVRCFYAVRARRDQLKQSYQPVLTYGVLAVAGLLVKPGQDLLLGIFSRNATAVVTGPARASASSFVAPRCVRPCSGCRHRVTLALA
jgi:hypothetical protein